MNFVVTPSARRQIERSRRWWESNREKAPDLFVEELEEAMAHLMTAPKAGEPWRIRRGLTIRRWLLEKTGHHLYYVHMPQREEVVVLALWGARRGRSPRL